jgi:ureidoglycolate lyase
VLDDVGSVGLSVGESGFVTLPFEVDLMERHPLGSQAFVPMVAARLVVIVAPDLDGRPGPARAFLSDGRQGIQYHANVWHGVLAPLNHPANVLIVDRVGPGNNLEEVRLETPYLVQAAPGSSE